MKCEFSGIHKGGEVNSGLEAKWEEMTNSKEARSRELEELNRGCGGLLEGRRNRKFGVTHWKWRHTRLEVEAHSHLMGLRLILILSGDTLRLTNLILSEDTLRLMLIEGLRLILDL